MEVAFGRRETFACVKMNEAQFRRKPFDIRGECLDAGLAVKAKLLTACIVYF